MQTGCLPCSGSNCACGNNLYLSNFNNSGTSTLRCVDCPKGYYSNFGTSYAYNCSACPAEGQIISSGSCSCDTLELQQSFCVNATLYAATVTSQFNPTSGYDVRYSPVISASSLTGTGRVSVSNTMQYLLPQALYECIKFQYYKQCQILANLCVLHMYREGATPCAALISLNSNSSTLQNSFYNDNGWKQNLPWLYYSNKGNNVIYQSMRLKAKMTLDKSQADSTRYAYVPFKLAKYSLDGEFLGWEDLSNQIWMCPVTVEDSKRYRRVGLGLVNTCEFDLQRLVSMTEYLPNLNYFFELFITDYNGDLIDVPVLIDNFVDAGLTYPNRENSDPASWRFVRRFFLYENVSSIEGTGEYLNPTKVSTYVSFIHESRLVFEIDTNSDETVYVPYLHLYYRTIESSTVTDSYPTPIVVVTQWKMDYTDTKQTLLAFFIVAHVLIVFWVAWKSYKWTTLHPQNYESTEFIFYLGRRVIYEVIYTWSNFIFWYLWVS